MFAASQESDGERSLDSSVNGDGIEAGPGDRLLSTVEFQYDLLGRRTHETVYRTKAPDDASFLEITTETVYTKRDEVERVIRPDGTARVSRYDRNGNLELQYLEETLLDGSKAQHQRRELRYDALDRLVEVEDARSGLTRFAYDAVGNRIATTDPEGNTTRVEYDALSRPVRVIDPNGAVTTTEYDAAGRVVAVTDASGVVTRRGYDAVGRLVSLQQGGSQAATREVFYDAPSPGDYAEELTDPNGNVTRFELDALGRVVRTIDATPQAGVTELEYDLRGDLTRFVDPEGAETRFGFDALGRNEQTQRPYALGPQETVYDELGNPIRVTKPDGCVLEQTYDAMSRLVRRHSTSACPGEVAAIDDRYGYDARGNLIAAQNARVGLIREYDSLDRPIREIDDRFGSAVASLYDDASRLTSKLYPNGSVVQISYDGAGRPIGITDRFGDTTRYVYDPAGRRIQTRGTKTGITTNLAYDANGRLASIESRRADQSVASHFAYPAYDEAGNRTQMEVLAGAGQTLGTTDYVYDALHRLIEETRPGEDTTHFEYDRAGNRTRSGSKSGSTWVAPYVDYAYDDAGPVTHRLTAITDDAGTPLHSFTAYDANGNPTEWDDGGGVRTLHWDALDRLVEISGAFQASYAYDPFGRRIEKTEAGTTTQYQYDGLDVVAEYDGTGALLATYLFGPGIDEPLEVERGATVAAYHTDGLGSVVAVSDAEAPAGGDLATYEYDAFGNLESSSGSLANAYTYTGRERDASGLYYYRARYYPPRAGRFLTPDPIGLQGGANPYVYVRSNPVNFRDPFGLEPFGGFLSVAAPSPTAVAEFGGQPQGLFAASAAPLLRPPPPLEVILGGAGSAAEAAGFGLRSVLSRIPYLLPLLMTGQDPFVAGLERALYAESSERERRGSLPGIVLDTGAIINFAVSATDPVVLLQVAAIQDRRILIPQTAFRESSNRIGSQGSPAEQARFFALLAMSERVPDNPSARFQRPETGGMGANDLIIFGTADQLRVPVLTTDARFVRAATQNIGPLVPPPIIVPPLVLEKYR